MPTLTFDVSDEAAAALSAEAARRGLDSPAALIAEFAADLALLDEDDQDLNPPPEVLAEVRRRQNDDLSNSRPFEEVFDELDQKIARWAAEQRAEPAS